MSNSEIVEEIELEADDLDVENDDEAAILAEFNADPDNVSWRIKIYRATPNRSGARPECFEIRPDELPTVAERLRNEYGTGDYFAQIRRNGKIYRNIAYAVEAPRNSTPQPAIRPDGSAMDTLSRLIERQDQRFQEILERISTGGTPAREINPMSMMREMMAAMVSMRELLGAGNGGGGNAAQQALDFLRQGIELGQTISAEGKETGMLDVLKGLIESPLLKTLTEGGQTPAISTAPAPQFATKIEPYQPMGGTKFPPVNQPEQPKPASPNPNMTPEMQQQIAILANNLKYLVQRAQRNGNPELYAEWAMDNIPLAIIHDLMKQPDPFAVILQFAPEATPYKEWFLALFDSVNQFLTEEAEQGNSGASQESADVPTGQAAT